MMLAWLSAAAIFNAVYRPARRGRKVAYLTVVSFAFLAFALSVMLLVDTEHRGQKRQSDAASLPAGNVVAADGAGGRA